MTRYISADLGIAFNDGEYFNSLRPFDVELFDTWVDEEGITSHEVSNWDITDALGYSFGDAIRQNADESSKEYINDYIDWYIEYLNNHVRYELDN